MIMYFEVLLGYFFHAEPANQFLYAKFETEKEDKKNPSEGMYIHATYDLERGIYACLHRK